MKINVDRMCELAGLGNSKKSVLNENVSDTSEVIADLDTGRSRGEGVESDSDEDIIEIDEVELVQELRRMKKLMAESQQRKQSLQEAELKKIIEQEIANLVKEMNLTAGWIYGKKTPKNSKKGFVNTTFAGPGFR